MKTTPAISYVTSPIRGQEKNWLARRELQLWAIKQFAHEKRFKIVSSYDETSLTSHDVSINRRPELRKALLEAETLSAPIIVDQLNRLCTSLPDLDELMARGAEFIVAGNSIEQKPFTLSQFEGSTGKSRRSHSDKIKAGLAAAKARGAVLGKNGRDNLAPRNRDEAQQRAWALADIIQPKLAAGKSLRTITDELNQEGVPTARGGRWHLASLQRVLARLRT